MESSNQPLEATGPKAATTTGQSVQGAGAASAGLASIPALRVLSSRDAFGVCSVDGKCN